MREYFERGFEVIRAVFSPEEINTINTRLKCYLQTNTYGVIMEEQSSSVRGIHGLHLVDEFFYKLSCHPKLLTLAEQIIGGKCYVHQFKVNMKKSQQGESWPWHQDFIFWNLLDGIAHPSLVNVCILLTETHSLSGPLSFIPGSHRQGNLCELYSDSIVQSNTASWRSDVSKELTYQVSESVISQLLQTAEAAQITGGAGDVLVFDPLSVHSSSRNLSDEDRWLLIITYNSIVNPPLKGGVRPNFLCSQELAPLYPCFDSVSVEGV